MPPYPSQAEIATMFEKINERGGGLMDHIDENTHVEVMGHEHSTERSHHSHGHVADLFGSFEFIDWEKTACKTRHVIGGGESSWACVEVVGEGISKKGKPIYHEIAFIPNFNTEGKIVQMRVYMDTAHVEKLFAHHNEEE